MNAMLKDQIRNMMLFYKDDKLVQIQMEIDHIHHLEETFIIIQEH